MHGAKLSSAPGVVLAAFVVLNLIVFTETGLLVGFFLPGDSLLVTAGLVGHSVGWPIHWLIPTLCVAAILGDSVRLPDRIEGRPATLHEGEVVLLPQGLPPDGARVLREARRQDDHPREVHPDHPHVRAGRCRGREDALSPVPRVLRHRRDLLDQQHDSARVTRCTCGSSRFWRESSAARSRSRATSTRSSS